jgi:hypothetical protein
LGLVAEVTYGTFVAPTRFLEFNSEGLTFNREKILSQGIRRGAYVQRAGRWAVNKKGGGGPATFEVATKGFGLPFKHAMGAVAITTPVGATNARQHLHTLGDLDDLSLTIQKGVPDIGGTTRAFSFLGCVITGWELSVDVDGLVIFTPTFDAQDMVTDEALATASFASADELFSYQQVAIEVDSGAVTPTSVSFSVSHAMKTDRHFVQASPLKKRPIRNGFAEITGSATFEFESMAQVNHFLNAAPGAEIPVQFTATGDEIDTGVNNYLLDVLAAKCVFDGEVPVVQGPDVITLTAPFTVVDDMSAEPITVTYVTTDTAS